MKEKDLSKDNSKKIIIGVSILFCTVILIIGATIAYFTQSDSKDIGNIVSTNQVTLEYKDDYNENTIYNRQQLIPSSLENVITAYNRTGDKKCLDELDYSACSVYRFSVKNVSEVSQIIKMSLQPTANSYKNLKFIMYEINDDSNVMVMSQTDLLKNSDKEIDLLSSYTLNPNNTKMYEIVFFIENQESDQTLDDAGKTFGAGIKINSITTGTYVTKQYGASCWTATLIPEGEENGGTYKLEYFHGLNDDGSVKEECSGYISQDTDTYYSVEIPAEVGGKQITTLGNRLFMASSDLEVYDPNDYNKIKKVIINDGITTIEDQYKNGYDQSSTFKYLGYVSDGSIGDYCLFDLEVSLPDSLIYIGNAAFNSSCIKDLKLPSNLKTIGSEAFVNNINLTSDVDNPLVIPYSVTSIGDSAFNNTGKITKLTFAGSLDIADVNELTIGASAFNRAGLSYTEKSAPLILPARLKSLGSMGFFNQNLKYVKYMGSAERFATVGGNYFYDTYAKSYEEYDNE